MPEFAILLLAVITDILLQWTWTGMAVRRGLVHGYVHSDGSLSVERVDYDAYKKKARLSYNSSISKNCSTRVLRIGHKTGRLDVHDLSARLESRKSACTKTAHVVWYASCPRCCDVARYKSFCQGAHHNHAYHASAVQAACLSFPFSFDFPLLRRHC